MATLQDTSKACEDPESDSNISTETQRSRASTKCPSEGDQSCSAEQALDSVIARIQKDENITIFETKEGTDKRRRIIADVEKVTDKVVQYCLEKHSSLSATSIASSRSIIRAFGSFELNAHFESSDIDLLCIGPKFVTRDMLFKELAERLESDPRVTDILQLRHAFVPLLKFTFQDVDIDLVYAQWDVDVIREESRLDIDVFSKNFVKDHDTLLCLNGVRSTETIKKLIPNKILFERTLRRVKLWAQRRAIYSNVMGFLGGISYSIMTAKICIQHPDATSCVELLRHFFAFYRDMHRSSASLKQEMDSEVDEDDYEELHRRRLHSRDREAPCIQLDHELFDHLYQEGAAPGAAYSAHSEYQRNGYTEIMPILTPARPAMNCAYNVIESTKRVILEELERGHALTAGIDADAIDWSQLLAVRPLVPADSSPSDGQNVFIQIQCIPDLDGHFAKKWRGYIESKVRNLVKKLNHKLFDSTFCPFANAIRSGNVDNLFIAGKYNVDFDHRHNNEQTINMVLQQFQNSIDISHVHFECASKCSLGLHVYYNSQIHDVLQQLEFANRAPQQHAQYGQTGANNQPTHPGVGMPGPGLHAPGAANALGAGVAPQPIYFVNHLQQIQLININPGVGGLGSVPLATAMPFVPFQHHNISQPPTPGAGPVPVPGHGPAPPPPPHAQPPHAQHAPHGGRGTPSHHHRHMRHHAQSPRGANGGGHHANHPRHARPHRRGANGPHRGHHHHQARDAHHAGAYGVRPNRHGGAPYGHGQGPPQTPPRPQMGSRHRQPAYPNLSPTPTATRNKKSGVTCKAEDYNKKDRESDSDTTSTESTPKLKVKEAQTAEGHSRETGAPSASPSETIQPLPGGVPPTLAKIHNISSFPIIKIEHHQLPHLPPMVSSQNGKGNGRGQRPRPHFGGKENRHARGPGHGGGGGPGNSNANVKYALSPCASSTGHGPSSFLAGHGPPFVAPPHAQPPVVFGADSAGGPSAPQQYYAWVFVPIQNVMPPHHGLGGGPMGVGPHAHAHGPGPLQG